jgi:hypothetical protein
MAANGFSPNDDVLAQHYLATLRDGDPPAKAAARRGLASIFEARALPTEAIELLLTSAREGYRDAELFRTLARLYRQVGQEALAAEAALESAKYSLPTGSAPGVADTLPLPASAPSSVPAPTRTSRPARAALLRGAGWLVALMLTIGAAGLARGAPLTAACYVVSALAMGLLASGWRTGRQVLRIPDGPLGVGALGLVIALAFLMGGALLIPRPVASLAPVLPTPGLATATPRPAAALAATVAPTPIPSVAATPAASQISVGRTDAATPAATAPTAAPTAPAPAAAVASPDPTAAPPAVLIVANAGADGVRLRAAPDSGDALKVLPDGASLQSLGDERQAGGRTWRRVRDTTGAEGWVAADFLSPRTSTMLEGTTIAPSPGSNAGTATPGTAAQTSRSPASAGQAQPRGGACPSTHPIKGNASSMIYHLPGGAFYSRTNPEACFATEADARAAGYRRSQR